MAKKRANGEGSIRKQKDGRWEGRHTAGHDPEPGKAIYKNVLGRTQAEAKGQPKGLSAKTVRDIHQILSSALKLAQEQRIILTNPAEGCALPKVEHREMNTLPVEQLASFLREAKESGVFELYYLELATGLRRGELLGLKWDDIDLERGDLRVRRQISRRNGTLTKTSLKMRTACRTLFSVLSAAGGLEFGT